MRLHRASARDVEVRLGILDLGVVLHPERREPCSKLRPRDLDKAPSVALVKSDADSDLLRLVRIDVHRRQLVVVAGREACDERRCDK